MEFLCSCCGQVHHGLADLVVAAPYYYFAMPEAERAARCVLTSDLCSIDDKDFFIRGCLEIPIIGADRTFSYGVWCSVSRANFERYRQVFDDERQAHVGPFFGWFSSRLPGYPETLTMKVRAHLRDGRQRPRFELEESDHPLSRECRQGISMERLQQLYELNLH